MGFLLVLKNVAIMMIYLVVGFVLVKSKLAKSSHAKSFSSFLIYCCGPCMVINAMLGMEHTTENITSVGTFFLATLIIQALFFLILFLIIRKKMENASLRIMAVGGVLGNVGFLGLPVIRAIFPDSTVVGAYSSIYVMSMNLIVFTMGVFMITQDKKYMSIKSAILNPTTIAILIALPLYFSNIELPEEVGGMISLLGSMATPICMVVLGMRLAAVKFLDLFKRPPVYISAALKLLVFPIFAYLCVLFLPFSIEFKVSVLILSACPTGAIVLSLAEIHECEQELSANVVLLSTLLSVVTLPLVMLVGNMVMV